MANEIRIRRTYESRDERTYARVYFEVPESTDRLEVEYSYRRHAVEARANGTRRVEANVVDLGLFDGTGRFRGWSGAERRSVMISPTSATPGYSPGPVAAGRWAVALGLYRISGSVDVDITIRMEPKREILLVGDLHVHTVNSDGACRTAEILDLCRRGGLDFVALTDHNSTRQNEEIPDLDGVTAIAGMEYTNYRGHANFFFTGERRRFDGDPLSGSFEEMTATFAAAKAMGAAISLNHPHCDNCPWTFGFEGVPYDLVEVWNGALLPGDARALQWWHAGLSAGARIPAIGGSDFHRHEFGRGIGIPSTFVYAASRSATDIMAALLSGRSSIGFSGSGPFVDIVVGGRGMGQEAKVGQGTEGTVTVRGVRTGDVLRIIDGHPRVTEREASFDGELVERFPVASDARFCRAEIWRRHPAGVRLLCAITNPVYISP